jgi:hypothetical protein
MAQTNNETPLIAGPFKDAWDRWYASIPADIKKKLSVHDLKRIGDCFKAAFYIQ